MFAIPLLWKIIAAGGVLVLLAGGALYVHNKIEQAGYDRAMDDVAKTNAVARIRLDEAVARSKSCRDFGGRWDQSRGLCVGQHE